MWCLGLLNTGNKNWIYGQALCRGREPELWPMLELKLQRFDIVWFTSTCNIGSGTKLLHPCWTLLHCCPGGVNVDVTVHQIEMDWQIGVALVVMWVLDWRLCWIDRNCRSKQSKRLNITERMRHWGSLKHCSFTALEAGWGLLLSDKCPFWLLPCGGMLKRRPRRQLQIPSGQGGPQCAPGGAGGGFGEKGNWGIEGWMSTLWVNKWREGVGRWSW